MIEIRTATQLRVPTLPLVNAPHDVQVLLRKEPTHITCNRALKFGDHHDGVIESAPILSRGGYIEVGYYFGDSKPKPIIKISPQVGCPAQCNFCEVGKEPFTTNLSALEMYDQVALMLQIVATYDVGTLHLPHKVSFAGTGEPLLNPNLFDAVSLLSTHNFSFKISTIFPKGHLAPKLIQQLGVFAASYSSSVQMQVSLVSTNQSYREKVIGPLAAPFTHIREAAEEWHSIFPGARKFNLSLILTEDTPASPREIKNMFPPELFRFRFRPYIPTTYGGSSELSSIEPERLARLKREFAEEGYDVNDAATPTFIEQQFGLASNVTRAREKSLEIE